MSHVGYSAKGHPQQVRGGETRDDINDRATPAKLFATLSARLGGFTVDVAASAANAKCDRYFDAATDGLEQPWAGERVWCNPPYSSIAPWIRKAWRETPACPLIALLLPSNRTEQPWWQTLVEPFRDRAGSVLRSEFLPGRPRFLRPGMDSPGRDERPPFGCVLLIWSSLVPAIAEHPLFREGSR